MKLVQIKDFLGLANTIKKAAKFLALSDDIIYIVTHIDTDGLTAAGILAHILYFLEKPFIIKFVSQLRKDFLIEFVDAAQPKEVIFCDIGSGQIDYIIKHLANAVRVYIFDHHIPVDIDVSDAPFKLMHVNPRLFGYDGGKDISAAGISYMLARVFASKNNDLKKLSKYAIVGALGDNQDIGEKKSLIGLNKLILDEGIRIGVLEAKIDLLISGRGSKPLYQALAETYKPILPGITNSLEGALNFIKAIGLGLGRLDMENITLEDLSEDQKALLLEKLVERLAITYGGKLSIDDIKNMLIGYVYLLKDETKNLVKDAREFSTLINACGKLGRPEIGLALVLGDREALYDEALTLYKQYRYMLSDALKKSRNILKDLDKIKLVDGRDWLEEGLTSTVASILAESIANGEIIVVISKRINNYVKVSARKMRNAKIKDVRKILLEVIKTIGGEGGGHESAAGAYILYERVDDFVRLLQENLDKELT